VPSAGTPGDGSLPGPTHATIQFEDGPVTILPRRAPVGNSGPIRGHTLAVFPSPATLPASLPEGRHPGVPGRIEPGDQPAHALLGLTEAEAVAVAQTLGLDAILFWDGRRAQILACR